MKKWTIDLVENPNTNKPYTSKDLLDNLDGLSLERLSKKEKTYTKYSIDEAKKSDIIKSLKGGLWRLKFTLPKRVQIRFLGTIDMDSSTPTFKVYCAFVKKDRTIPQNYINLTRDRIES